MIRSGSLRPGDRLPSVRALSRSRRVSPSTVLQAYDSLVAEGLIEPRPRSGYFVLRQASLTVTPRFPASRGRPTRVAVSDLVFDILEASRDRGIVPLGSAFPGPGQFPWAKLARYLGSRARRLDPWQTVESLPPGSLELRREIARRYLAMGMSIGVEQIIITSGALEALSLSLETVVRRGDAIAVESPAFYGCLQAAERLGVHVVEIPTHPTEGVDLTALSAAVSRGGIKACWLMTTLQHPTGATMSRDRKRRLVEMLSERGIPLIEDDAYAELQYSPPVPPAKAFDEKGYVLHCGSFSKCLAPGYRLGWVAAGRFTRQVARRKIESTLATSLPVQLAIAEMMRHGGYEGHLVQLRRRLAIQQRAALDSIRRHFPEGYRLAPPSGGYFLWIECAQAVDSLTVHRLALDFGISIAPGPMFSARRRFRNYLRLNYGHPWLAPMDQAVQRLGQILRRF